MPDTTIAIRVNGQERVITTLEEWEAVSWFVKASFAPVSGAALKAKTLEDAGQRMLPLQPPPGERMIDYAMKAAAAVGSPFTIRKLVDQMVSLGWQTRSKDVDNMLSTVRTIISRSAQFTKLGDGKWRFDKEKE